MPQLMQENDTSSQKVALYRSLFGSDFSANYYQVQVKVGTPQPTYDDANPADPTTAGYRAAVTAKQDKTTHVNASIVRLYKLDDDTIFRTSGGG